MIQILADAAAMGLFLDSDELKSLIPSLRNKICCI